MHLSPKLADDFEWWRNNIFKASKPIKPFEFAMEIFSDACPTGWGAHCLGEKVNGHWRREERHFHINYLEMQAAFFGLKVFAADLRMSDILLRIDNSTTIAYVNKMGGTRSKKLNALAKVIWKWCESRGLRLYASYISSSDNFIADIESRKVEPEIEYELNSELFVKICEEYGVPEIDLFASRANAKCSKYVSWKRDPESMSRPSSTSSAAKSCGRDRVRQTFALKGMSKDSIDLMFASITKSSLRQYEGAWKRWFEFCDRKKLETTSINILEAQQFLAEQFNNGASAGTINSYRSALAFIFGEEVAHETSIKRLCKGASKLRPPQPKYDCTWDPKIVLNLFESWPQNEELSLENLTLKLATLLALTTGHRIQTLSLIDILNITKSDNGLTIKIPAPIKTSAVGRKQPALHLPFYVNEKICVARALEHYMARTQEIRVKETSLFLSFKKPHRAVNPQSISRWIKKTLNLSGIDTEIFSAYSTRHASTSAAKRLGVSLDVIKSTAGWTENSRTFAKFYDLPIAANKNEFAIAILNQ
ncbi:hypothetical protein TKK_0009598 [Trichogramma kaykai]